jgi:hypothetical protein
MREKVRNGRFSTRNDEDIVLFLIGLRINKWRAVRTWLPVVRSMRPLLDEAGADPESGLLGHRTHRHGLREIVVVQYWRSTKDLIAFSNGDSHRRVWADFYRLATVDAGVGLWHETYVVPAGRYEAIFGMVPQLGLATVRDVVPIGRRNDRALVRLGESEAELPKARRAAGGTTATSAEGS